jgi:hypothetical protein
MKTLLYAPLGIPSNRENALSIERYRMAAHPIVTIHDGKVEIPEELKDDPRFCDGARLELVPASGQSVQTDSGAWQAFIDLQGIFADDPGDANASLERERQDELAEEAR